MKSRNALAVTSLFVIIIAAVIHAQPPEVEWTSGFSGGGSWAVGNSVQQTLDGGYIVTGSSTLDHYFDQAVLLAKTNSI